MYDCNVNNVSISKEEAFYFWNFLIKFLNFLIMIRLSLFSQGMYVRIYTFLWNVQFLMIYKIKTTIDIVKYVYRIFSFCKIDFANYEKTLRSLIVHILNINYDFHHEIQGSKAWGENNVSAFSLISRLILWRKFRILKACNEVIHINGRSTPSLWKVISVVSST